jgi:two-component system response regulator YesN|nr:helix-turn-helix domain-containing protein [uncultured Acetatifactor sp.]
MIKILLVDDEYHVISHITNLLGQIDFCEISTLKTTSGPEALELAASSHIDIAFLDINMPRVSGLQIAGRIHNQWPDCQLIFLTAYEVFDYIYEAGRYPGAIYLLKAESDSKILDVAVSCCRAVLRKREERSYLSDVQRKEKLLLLLQEQQLLREVLHGNLTGDLERFAKSASLDIHFSLEKDMYLMLMHIRRSPSSVCDFSFYLEKMEQLLGNLFLFSFVETDKGILLWFFQERDNPEKEISYFNSLKDTMDSFLDICARTRHQTLSLCLYREKTAWDEVPNSYQFLYDSYYEESSLLSIHSPAARIIEKKSERSDNTSSVFRLPSAALSGRLSSMKQALYQGNRDLFFTELLYCRRYCTAVKSMHYAGAIKLYFSIVLIYLEYIEHYKLEARIAMEIAIYPLYYITDFPDWEHAFSYLSQLGEVIFRIANESNSDKTRQLIASIQHYIQQHLSENLNLAIIADFTNYNESHISRLFKRYTGSNLSEYITSCRIEYAKSLLVQTKDTIQVISQKTGFRTSQYFSSTFRKSTGVSPNEYRIRKR